MVLNGAFDRRILITDMLALICCSNSSPWGQNMSHFDLFIYVVRLSEVHIVSNYGISAIISNRVMRESVKVKSRHKRFLLYELCMLFQIS